MVIIAAKGAISKEIIINEIIKTFEGSFLNGKELRIPMVENGEQIEIKVTLTCAKNLVGAGVAGSKSPVGEASATPQVQAEILDCPTEEEKQNLEMFIQNLGL